MFYFCSRPALHSAAYIDLIIDKEVPMTGPGRPTLYREAYAETAHNYCLLGATNDELAGFFNVAPSTVDNWLAAYPEFATAVRNGRAAADASIARKLYRRADGYDYTAEKLFCYRGEVIRADHKVHLPPDVGAARFWLRNRRPQDWQERRKPEPEGIPTFEYMEEAIRREDAQRALAKAAAAEGRDQVSAAGRAEPVAATRPGAIGESAAGIAEIALIPHPAHLGSAPHR